MFVIALEAPSDTKSDFHLVEVKITSVEGICGYNMEGKIE